MERVRIYMPALGTVTFVGDETTLLGTVTSASDKVRVLHSSDGNASPNPSDNDAYNDACYHLTKSLYTTDRYNYRGGGKIRSNNSSFEPYYIPQGNGVHNLF